MEKQRVPKSPKSNKYSQFTLKKKNSNIGWSNLPFCSLLVIFVSKCTKFILQTILCTRVLKGSFQLNLS